LPQQQNSAREPLTKERKQGLLISALIHIVLAILIIFITFRIKMPELSEEGLLVNFGYDETGQGLYEPAPQAATPPPPPPSSSADDEAADEAILTQDFEEAPVVEKKEPDPEELRKQAEARAAAEKRRQEEALAAAKLRREQAIADSIRRVEENQRQVTATTNARAASAFGNAGNTGTTGQSQGVAGGQGNQGVPEGTVGAERYGPGGGTGNISFSLGDRGASALPYPQYDYQGEGKVVVEVTVDQSGRVTNARSGVVGSTTQDEYLLRVAREAALKARFDSRPNTPIQKGTITYIFKLK